MSAGTDYLAVWHSGTGAQWWATGLSPDEFKAKDKAHFDQGLRLVDIELHSGTFTAVWHPGSGAQWWATGLSLDEFKAKDKAYFDQGLRLVDIDSHLGAFTAVWRPGSGGQWWATGLSLDEFKAKDKGYFDQGLRLARLSVAGGKYIAVWRTGAGAQWWAAELSYDDFKAKDKAYYDQGLRLVDIELHDGKFTGVWRPGAGPQWWFFGDDYERFASRDKGYFGNGLRLLKIFPYTGKCDGQCLNLVVMPTNSYNYAIARTAEHCPGLPGTCGTPGPGEVVFYRWPCITFDGSQRYERLSAVTFSDAPLFQLPFSDPTVKQSGTWLYKAGSWHHALDLRPDDRHSFEVRAAAAGRVVFIGWDWWSGNTIVMSHDSGGVQDAFRTIYMHLRNGPTHDADQAWNITVPKLTEPRLSQYKTYLTKTGCPKGGPYNADPKYWGTDADKIDTKLLGKNVSAGTVIAHAGCSGPGGCGCTDDQASYTWGGGVNTHLHIFFARRDPSDNEWYFIDPYGIYGPPGCYPSTLTDPITTACARYPISWKGGKPQYP